MPLFRESTTLEPTEPAFWRDLGQALVDDGKVAEAIAPLERAVSLRPNGANERFWLARAYLLAGRTAEVEAAIGPRTAALVYIVSPGLAREGVPEGRMAAIAHAHGLPLIVDAASTLPPVNHLRRWTELGADLVILSGGKGIRGPQNTGLLVGRRDLIRAVHLNAAPHASIGRPCKVSKEAIIGLVTAVEMFIQTDHEAEWARHLDEARRIVAAVEGRPGVRATIEEDRSVWTAPTVLLDLDPAVLATRGDLEGFLRGDEDNRLGTGWRAEALAEDIEALLHGRAGLSFARGEGLVLKRWQS